MITQIFHVKFFACSFFFPWFCQKYSLPSTILFVNLYTLRLLLKFEMGIHSPFFDDTIFLQWYIVAFSKTGDITYCACEMSTNHRYTYEINDYGINEISSCSIIHRSAIDPSAKPRNEVFKKII